MQIGKILQASAIGHRLMQYRDGRLHGLRAHRAPMRCSVSAASD